MQRSYAASQNRDPGFFESRATEAPARPRTAPQGLRAALRPGHADTSIQLDAGLADQSRPGLVFGRDKTVELVVRDIPGLAATLLKTFLQIGQCGADFPPQ